MPLPIDYPAWRFWFDFLQLSGICAVGVYTWWSNREKVTSKKFGDLEERLAHVETAIAHPRCEYHLGFETRLDTMHGDIRELTGGIKGLRRAVDLMNEYLINKGGTP